MAEYEFETVDVFTDQRFGGNPLAVILDARGLTTEQMLQITCEFNFAESSFILPPSDPENTAQVRIFTPAQEIPFAGHPNVGTAYVLANRGVVFGRPVGAQLRFEEKVGLVTADVVGADGEVQGAKVLCAADFDTRIELDRDVIAPCLSLTPADLASGQHAPVIASVGLAFCVVELTSMEALRRCEPSLAAFRQAAQTADAMTDDRLSIYAYVRTGIELASARMFAPWGGTVEDAATGSAAGALGGLLASLSDETDGEFNLAITQGVEMGRPSEISVRVALVGGRVGEVEIGGNCVAVSRGRLTI
jgi:trans-2,3-dihydro-3-hydroxyanthranilate isomerase